VTSVDRGTGTNLTRDFVATNDATFVVDVPNGTYEVTVTLGDASSKRDQMTVWLEGSQVANVSTNSGQFKTLTFTVTVTDNQLTVRFLDTGGRTPQLALNALKVVKVMPGLTLSINPTTVSEGAGATAATGTVTRAGDLSQPLSVTLTSSDTTEATVPATVTIPAGQASATFTIAAINDTIIDGTQVVTVTARATNYRDGSALLSVADDDRKQFPSAKFDFGTAASPVAGGFSQVTPTTSFSESAGYGWLAGTIGATDRNSGSDTNRDFNSTGNGTFVVNVPNGTYSATITLGDAAAAHDRMAINLEGARVDNNISTAAGQFSRRTYSVTVSDGQLTLQLQDLGGKDGLAVINALELTQTGGAGLAWGGTAGEIARLLEATTERDRLWFRRAGG
jgi:fibronectin type 3 domain-containing protein